MREAAPANLDPLLVLDTIAAQGHLEAMHVQASMQCLALTGHIVAGFVLLERAGGLLSRSDENCYLLFHPLLEACRMLGDSYGASGVQAAVDRLALPSLAPMASSCA